MNAASIAPGGDVQQNVVKNAVTNVVTVTGNEVGSRKGKQDNQAPEARLHTPSTPAEKLNSTITRHRKLPAGLAGAVKSVSDRISSSVSKVTDRVKGGRAETGKASRRAETAKPASGTSK